MAELTHGYFGLPVAEVLRRLANRSIVMAGERDGRDWILAQQARLLVSLESGWPIGTPVVWMPEIFSPVWHVLDGHRRLAVIAAMANDKASPLARDLAIDTPTYLDRTGGDADPARYLPVNAMGDDLAFTIAARGLHPDRRDRAEVVIHRVLRHQIAVLLLAGGTATDLARVCNYLMPRRVDPATMSLLAGHGAG